MKDTVWYSPGEIHFRREEMIWLISWLGLLSEGNWPPEGKETGYSGYQKNRGHKAPFETPAEYAAEVKSRLKTTLEAGEALVDEVQGGILNYEELCGPARRVLNYISGWRRRKETYSRWKATQVNRGKFAINIWQKA